VVVSDGDWETLHDALDPKFVELNSETKRNARAALARLEAEAQQREAEERRERRALLAMFEDLRPALEAADEQPIVHHAWRVRNERDALRAEVERLRTGWEKCQATAKRVSEELCEVDAELHRLKGAK
jgi:hypothetical protein